jgi:hypothetical protein
MTSALLAGMLDMAEGIALAWWDSCDPEQPVIRIKPAASAAPPTQAFMVRALVLSLLG